MFSTEKIFELIGNFLCNAETFVWMKGPEYFFELFDVLLKPTPCEMKVL